MCPFAWVPFWDYPIFDPQPNEEGGSSKRRSPAARPCRRRWPSPCWSSRACARRARWRGQIDIWLWLSKPMVFVFGVGELTTHFRIRTYFSGWIGMFPAGTIWLLTHSHVNDVHQRVLNSGLYHAQGTVLLQPPGGFLSHRRSLTQADTRSQLVDSLIHSNGQLNDIVFFCMN